MSSSITIQKQITNEELGDIIATAFEGGIGYWSQVEIPKKGTCERKGAEDYWEIVPAGGTIKVHTPDDNGLHILDKIKLVEGIQLAVDKGSWDAEDTGDIDSDVADNIIQSALFQELVYG